MEGRRGCLSAGWLFPVGTSASEAATDAEARRKKTGGAAAVVVAVGFSLENFPPESAPTMWGFDCEPPPLFRCNVYSTPGKRVSP